MSSKIDYCLSFCLLYQLKVMRATSEQLVLAGKNERRGEEKHRIKNKNGRKRENSDTRQPLKRAS